MTGAIFALVRSTSELDVPRQWLWSIAAAALLGIAISLNTFVASFFLLFVLSMRGRPIALTLTAAIPIALSIPFGWGTVWNSLGQVAQLSRLNDLFLVAC